MITEKNYSIDSWVCPHCNVVGSCTIIENAVLKDDFRELLCGCHSCEELFVRQYKLEKIIPVYRKEI